MRSLTCGTTQLMIYGKEKKCPVRARKGENKILSYRGDICTIQHGAHKLGHW